MEKDSVYLYGPTNTGMYVPLLNKASEGTFLGAPLIKTYEGLSDYDIVEIFGIVSENRGADKSELLKKIEDFIKSAGMETK